MDPVLVAGGAERAARDARALYLPDRDLFLTGLPNFKRFFVRDTLWFANQIMALPEGHAARSTYLSSVPSALTHIATHQATTPTNLHWMDILEQPSALWCRIMRDAEFGRMPHEIPRNAQDWLWLKMHFGVGFMRGHPYYGSIDATPLWLLTLAEYVRQTGDPALAMTLRESVYNAYTWILEALERSEGLVRYGPRRRWNIKHHAHQGWRDGAGSGGIGAFGMRYPVALLDVQCLAYRALRDAHILGAAIDAKPEWIDGMARRAEVLRQRILDSFWMPQTRAFAFALHGNNEPVNAVTIEQVLLIWCGVIPRYDRRRISIRMALLHADHLWTEYGPRTLSASDPRFDAARYHRGAVWPWLGWLAYESMQQDGYGNFAAMLRHATLRGMIEMHGNDELFIVTENGDLQRSRKAASPCLWTVGAALALTADELQ